MEGSDGEVVLQETFELAADEGLLSRDAITEEGDYDIELSLGAGVTERWTTSLPDENERPLAAYTVTIFIDEDVELVVLHRDPAPTSPGC